LGRGVQIGSLVKAITKTEDHFNFGKNFTLKRATFILNEYFRKYSNSQITPSIFGAHYKC
jgi:hypothetical protein